MARKLKRDRKKEDDGAFRGNTRKTFFHFGQIYAHLLHYMCDAINDMNTSRNLTLISCSSSSQCTYILAHLNFAFIVSLFSRLKRYFRLARFDYLQYCYMYRKYKNTYLLEIILFLVSTTKESYDICGCSITGNTCYKRQLLSLFSDIVFHSSNCVILVKEAISLCLRRESFIDHSVVISILPSTLLSI